VFEWRYAEPLIDNLVAQALQWAGLRGQCIRRLQLIVDHGRHHRRYVPVSTDSGASKDVWMRLIPLAIERTGFKDWVVGFALEILELRALEADSGELWPGAVRPHRDLRRLLETLETRLGAESIEALYCYPDHRPERAYLKDVPGQSYGLEVPLGQRPCWLLPEPEILSERFYRGGRLRLLSGPERIEGGWWEGRDIRRDYFVAAHPAGSLYWIFRECEGQGHWYLHGIFA
jgi:protein ImuB